MSTKIYQQRPVQSKLLALSDFDRLKQELTKIFIRRGILLLPGKYIFRVSTNSLFKILDMRPGTITKAITHKCWWTELLRSVKSWARIQVCIELNLPFMAFTIMLYPGPIFLTLSYRYILQTREWTKLQKIVKYET